MIQVMIIDDSAVVRETLKQILEKDPTIKVIATASDPIIATKKLETLKPDVITLDVEMPRMDGITFLKNFRANSNIPVIVCSSMVETNSSNALLALEYGATDIIQKPKVGTKQFLEESQIVICDAVKAAYSSKNAVRKIVYNANTSSVDRRSVPAAPVSTKSEVQGRTSDCRSVPLAPDGTTKNQDGTPKTTRSVPLAPSSPVQPKLTADVMLAKGTGFDFIETTEKIVVVGASTGGTEALRVFLEKLPVSAPGVVVVQHMPENFTKSFAERLDSICKVHVSEAKDNDSIIRGNVLIAPGNKHLLVKRSGARYFVEIKDGPLVTRHRPSVDVLFRSTARYAGKNAIGVIMTGMGDDGARGMSELHDAGAYTIAQDENSCVVFGMPQEAIKLNAVDVVLPLEDIADEIILKTK